MLKPEIIAHFNKLYSLNKEQKLYLEIHSKRFELILQWINGKKFDAVLDIGPSFLSELLYEIYDDRLSLMGFDSSTSAGGHLANNNILNQVKFIAQDLNFLEFDRISQTFDLIVCAEVLEHLYTSPTKLFLNLYQLTKPKGHLIIQTPNAVSLKKRIAMLLGRNPFEIPRENLQNPGHYREYTSAELEQFALEAGFQITELIHDEYFEYPSFVSKTYRSLKNVIPRNLKSGITLILQKP